MKEKLIIRNFGPIKDIELDLGKVTVLIGEQATGKSTVAKVLAVCRYFSYIVGEKGNEIANYHKDTFVEGLVTWGLNECISRDSVIQYECPDYSLDVRHGEVVLKREVFDTIIHDIHDGLHVLLHAKSNRFKNLLTELDKIKPSLKGVLWTIPTSFFLNDVKNVMDNPFYFPTQRGLQSIFDIGQSSIRNLSSSLFNQFAKLDGIARLFKQETYIEPLDIYYVNRDGHGFIRKANESEYYSLYNAASGYQTMIPLVLAVKYYTELRKRAKTLIIEEPELDVFPAAQYKLVKYLTEKIKVHDSMLFLTTHSPYTLTSLNNLMYAYQVGQIDSAAVSEKIDKKYWLNPDDVSAYLLKPDGSYENIKDGEGLIRAEKIDEVSKIINKEFSDLMDIEIRNDETNN